MFSAGRQMRRIMAGAMILAGSLAFGQGVPSLVTELRDRADLPAAVRIEMPDQKLVALAQLAKPDSVTVKYRISDAAPLRDYVIVPLAEVRMFLKTKFDIRSACRGQQFLEVQLRLDRDGPSALRRHDDLVP